MTKDRVSQDITVASSEEAATYREIVELFHQSPVPDTEVLKDIALFLTRPSLAHVLFLDSLYRRILDVHGSILEFGVKWGRTTSLFTLLRHIYEPYNLSRRVIGFDTFGGYPAVSKEDGEHEVICEGAFAVPDGYEEHLERLLTLQERLAPRPQVKKFELVKGDATRTFGEYLEAHPELICALAYFDFDLYEPTRVCLELLKDRLTKGSILVFDELAWEAFPGETRALQEVLGSRNVRLQRDPRLHYQAFIVCE